MTFKSAFAHLAHPHTSVPAIATNMSLDKWSSQIYSQPPRFVRKVEICTALTEGDDAWGTLKHKSHRHTLLRVSLATNPAGDFVDNDVLLIERVLSTGELHHSVTPISEGLPNGGTLFHPDVHDRMCVVLEGSPGTIARHLEVERTLEFGDSAVAVSLVQMTDILDLVSRATQLMCANGDCQFQSRSFAFACLAALTPRSTPVHVHKGGKGIAVAFKHSGSDTTLPDSVFEEAAEICMRELPGLVEVSQPGWTETMELISTLKGQNDTTI